MADLYEEFRKKVEGTNIDPRSLLSTDYFNHFNTVIMLLGMLPDMPEMLGEIDQWTYISYAQHFKESGLDFAPLAIEAYEHAPKNLRDKFDRKVQEITNYIEMSRLALRKLLETGDMERFAELTRRASSGMQAMIDEGGAIIHGHEVAMDQSAIDNLFE